MGLETVILNIINYDDGNKIKEKVYICLFTVKGKNIYEKLIFYIHPKFPTFLLMVLNSNTR